MSVQWSLPYFYKNTAGPAFIQSRKRDNYLLFQQTKNFIGVL